jgi:NAD(P)H dehydrogenase (quinone)
VFILPPSEFDPEPGYPEARAVINSVVEALRAAKPGRVLCLSTIGADAKQDNLLSQRGMMEAAFRELQIPLTILRPAWFIDNAAWDVASARDTGLIHSFLLPTDKAFPMVAAKDVGRMAAELIREDWTGIRVVELEGPYRLTPNDLADAFARVIGKPVRAVPVPRESWAALFRSQGMRNPEPRMRMLDGFNEGWIEFEDGGSRAIKGSTNAVSVIAALVANTEA